MPAPSPGGLTPPGSPGDSLQMMCELMPGVDVATPVPKLDPPTPAMPVERMPIAGDSIAEIAGIG